MTEGSVGEGLLAGLRVLDMSVWRPGPYATQLLAEIGADVLKVEPPGGDPMRQYPELFASLSANKRSIVIDLKSSSGRGRLLQLAADADVLIEGFRPGVADRLGAGYSDVQTVNPAIIYCSVSGMGQDGPLSLVPGHDLNYLAWAGSLAPDGGSPAVPAIPVADLAGGMTAAFAVCAAVVRRLRTGEGERIDVAMADVLATWTGAASSRARGVDSSAREVPGYGLFETASGGAITLGVLTEDHFWRPLCIALGLAGCEDLGFVDRMERVAELKGRLAESIRRRGRDELVAELVDCGVPVAPVLDREEMLGLEHFLSRGVVAADPWPGPGAGPVTRYPVRFERHSARRSTPPPELDEHHGAAWLPGR